MRSSLRTRSLRAVAALGVASLLLAGCSGKDTSEEGSAAPSSNAPSSSASADDELAVNAARAEVDPANPPKPLATTTMPAEAATGEKATMDVDLVSLRREDKLLVVTLGFRPQGEGLEPKSLYEWLSNHSPDIRVVDGTNLKVHEVVRPGPAQEVQTDVVSTEFGPGDTFYYSSVLAAPPAGAKLSVHAVAGAGPFTGITAP